MAQILTCAGNARILISLTPASLLFKMDWVMMSIVILCILATALYSCINVLEKQYHKKW